MTHILTFDVRELLIEPVGTRHTYTFDGRVTFEEVKTTSNITGRVELMKIDEGINVRAEQVEVTVESSCSQCLKSFGEKVRISSAERQFFLKPQQKEDPLDTYLVDKKNFSVDISEMLRQEIILHFSEVPVCSKSCKAVWEEVDTDYKPLAKLKELLQ